MNRIMATNSDTGSIRSLRSEIVSPRPLTSGYDSATNQMLMWMMNHIQQVPQFSIWRGELMQKDGRVSFGLQIGDAPLYSAKVKVDAGSKQVQEFAAAQFDRAWLVPRKILQTKLAGWSAYEAMYRRRDALVELDYLRDFHPLDSNTLSVKSKRIGIRIRQVRSRKSGYVDLIGMKGLWTSFRAKYGKSYGESLLEKPYPYWWEKVCPQGAYLSRRLRFMRDAWTGDVVWYPTDAPDQRDGDNDPRSWKDIIREIIQLRMNGAPLLFPKQTDGTKLLEYERPQSIQGTAEILEWARECDKEILVGLDIPPEVVQAAETGSGFSGRSIPFVSYVSVRDQELTDYVQAIDKQIIRPLVWLNFGRKAADDYTITPVPLLETVGEAMGNMGRPDVNQPHQIPGQTSPFGQQQPFNGMQQRPQNQEAMQFALDDNQTRERIKDEAAATVARGDKKKDSVTSQSVVTVSPVLEEMRKSINKILSDSKASDPYTLILEQIENSIAGYQGDLSEILADASTGSWVLANHDIVKSVTDAAPSSVITHPLQSSGGYRSPPVATGADFESPEPKVRLSIVESAFKWLTDQQAIDSASYYERNASDKAQAFTITGDLSVKSIDHIRSIIADEVKTGTSRTKTIARIREELPSLPLSESHLEMVYRNAVNSSYSQGYENGLRQPIVENAFPYRMIVAVHDMRARPEHRAMEFLGLNGTAIYYYKDPTFIRFRGPWAWGCRCGFVQLTVERAAEMGVVEAQEWLRTGIEPEHVPVTPPPFSPPPEWDRSVAVQFSMEDAQGHLHKGSGKGGGQFISKDKAGFLPRDFDSDDDYVKHLAKKVLSGEMTRSQALKHVKANNRGHLGTKLSKLTTKREQSNWRPTENDELQGSPPENDDSDIDVPEEISEQKKTAQEVSQMLRSQSSIMRTYAEKFKDRNIERHADVAEQHLKIHESLLEAGFEFDTITKSGSAYYKKGDRRIRVSDHEVPDTRERQWRSADGGFSWATDGESVLLPRDDIDETIRDLISGEN